MVDGQANALDNMNVEYTYHYHDSSCANTCTITTSWDYSSMNSGKHCNGESSGDAQFNCFTGTTTHSDCGAASTLAVKHLGSGTPTLESSTHTYYTCGYSDGQIIEVKLSIKK